MRVVGFAFLAALCACSCGAKQSAPASAPRTVPFGWTTISCPKSPTDCADTAARLCPHGYDVPEMPEVTPEHDGDWLLMSGHRHEAGDAPEVYQGEMHVHCRSKVLIVNAR
jgi:hypothetical protein